MPNILSDPQIRAMEPDETVGVITDEGMEQAQLSAGRAGWNINISRFAVSDQKGELSASRTQSSILPTWYESQGITNPTRISPREIRVSLTIPTGQIDDGTRKEIAEVYIFAKVNKLYLESNGDLVGELPPTVSDDITTLLGNLQDYLFQLGKLQYKPDSPRIEIQNSDFDSSTNKLDTTKVPIGVNDANGTIYYIDNIATDKIIDLPTVSREAGHSVTIYNVSDHIVTYDLGNNETLPLYPYGVLVLIIESNGDWNYIEYKKQRFNDFYLQIWGTHEFLFAIVQPTLSVMYAPTITFTLNPHFKFNAIPVDSVFQFTDSTAYDIEQHNRDPFAHQYIRHRFLNSEWSVIAYPTQVINENTFQVKGNNVSTFQPNRRIRVDFDSNRLRPITEFSRVVDAEYEPSGDWTQVTISDDILNDTAALFYYALISQPSIDFSFDVNDYMDLRYVTDTSKFELRGTNIGKTIIAVPSKPDFSTVIITNLSATQIPYADTDSSLKGSIDMTYSESTRTTALQRLQIKETTQAPMVIASTTEVLNLNSELWGGYKRVDYLNQPVRTTDSPTFVNVTATNFYGTATSATKLDHNITFNFSGNTSGSVVTDFSGNTVNFDITVPGYDTLQTDFANHIANYSAHGATSVNTANRIVLRDASGGFNAGQINCTVLVPSSRLQLPSVSSTTNGSIWYV